MDINRDNYEEYFLLYADNEVSEQEKNAIEAFVKQHPDLEEELLILKLSVNKPDDDCMLEDKSFLFKETDKFISHSNYEEIFVLYNDDELTGYERKEVEVFLLENPTLKNEFELLQKTKLEADNTIVFYDKKLLYRKEDHGKVILFKWWKAAAAAILVGIGIWSGVAYLHTNDTKVQSTVENNTIKKPGKTSPVPFDTKTIEPVNVVVEKETKTQRQKLIVKRNISKPSIKKTGLRNDLPVVKNKVKANNLPGQDIITENIEKEQATVQAQTKIETIRENIETDNSTRKISKGDELIANEDSSPKALTTSFRYDENENNNNYAFYNIPQEKFNRSKLGGFLRKVKRIVERKISPLNSTKDKTEIAVN